MVRAITSVFLVAALTVAAGCGASAKVSFGDETVSKQELEQRGIVAMKKAVGEAPNAVVCPDSLDAKVGATERCTLKADGGSLGMTVTVTKVDGDDVRLHYDTDK
jgi:hypothetical protein